MIQVLALARSDEARSAAPDGEEGLRPRLGERLVAHPHASPYAARP
jgi:hypothetical protein